jgi:hypothetical protein
VANQHQTSSLKTRRISKKEKVPKRRVGSSPVKGTIKAEEEAEVEEVEEIEADEEHKEHK